MISKLKLIAIPLLSTAIIASGAMYTKLVYDSGIRSCSNKYEKQIAKFEQHQREVADEVSRLKKERDQLKGERLKALYTAPDPTGCADLSIPDSLQDIRRTRSPRSSPP